MVGRIRRLVHRVKRLVDFACGAGRTARKVRASDARRLVNTLRGAKNLDVVARGERSRSPSSDGQGVGSAGGYLRPVVDGDVVDAKGRTIADPLVCCPAR